MPVNSILRNKSILVTGAAGFIGSNLAIRLVKAGAKVTAIDNFDQGCGGNLNNIASILDKINFLQMDLRQVNGDFVKNFQYIFNLAGSASHVGSMMNPAHDWELNAQSHISLLEACRESNRDAIVINTGTRQVYGTAIELPVTEAHPIAPVDINGISKYAQEQMLIMYGRLYGIKGCSLRLTNTYGPRQLIKNASQGFVGWFVNRILTDQPIEIFGDGLQLRDFSYVDDVVEALILSALTPQCWGQAFNLSGERCSLIHFANLLVQTAGTGKIEKISFPELQKKIDVGNFYASSKAFFDATGWVPTTPIKEGLKKMLSFYSRHRSAYLQSKMITRLNLANKNLSAYDAK